MSVERGHEAQVMFELHMARGGRHVFLPTVPSTPVDAIVTYKNWDPREGFRVQVKRTYPKGGKPTVNMVRAGGRKYSADDCDVLVAVDADERRLWWIPWYLVCNRTRLTLSGKWDKYATDIP